MNLQYLVDKLVLSGIPLQQANSIVYSLYDNARNKSVVNLRLIRSICIETDKMVAVEKYEEILKSLKKDIELLQSDVKNKSKMNNDAVKGLFERLSADLDRVRSHMTDSCKQFESGLELDVNLEKHKTLENIKLLEEKVNAVPYYWNKKLQKVGHQLMKVKRVAKIVPVSK
jgi:hypothetical protein